MDGSSIGWGQSFLELESSKIGPMAETNSQAEVAPPPIRFFEAADGAPSSDSLFDIVQPGFDFRLIVGSQKFLMPEQQTHFGFVFKGQAELVIKNRTYPLAQGMYFTAVGKATLRTSGSVLSVSQKEHRGLFSLGGPIEAEGRLRYIDGCSDTLLIPPLVKGDACLNFLMIPSFTNQTSHTHPSFRYGIIVSGSGFCDSPTGTEQLDPGKVFFIPPDGPHRFRTQREPLAVIAFHPDSDFGPEDNNHPMVNKTIVNGVPAAQLSHQQRGISNENQS